MTRQNLDTDLLRLLEEDARASISVLAVRLGVSRSTVRNRMEKLEKDGTIHGYTVRYTDEYEKNRVRAHVMISVSTKDSSHVERALQKVMGVRTIHGITGDFDLLAIVDADNTAILDGIFDAIWGIEGVEDTHSVILLGTRFKR